MKLKMLKKDLQRNKVTATALFTFILLASLLAGSATTIVSTLFASIDSMFMASEPPHFLQMHAGNIDERKIQQFSEMNTLVSKWQISEALVADGSVMYWNDSNEADTASVMENYFVTQNKEFDYLLNLHNKPVEVSSGEIAVPVYYMVRQHLKIGDALTIKTKTGNMTFRISDFIRDAQTNPSIVSSKRFVVSQQDFANLHTIVKEREYSVAFLLTDLSKLDAFSAAYLKAGLPNKGPTIDITLLRLMNALTDGVTAVIVFLVCLLLVGIAFLCLRFAILSTLEEDYREIGVMKAIGIQQKNIRKLYLTKYIALAAVGCILGCILSFVTSRIFTANIALYIGESKMSLWQSMLPIIASVLLFLITLLFCSLIFRKIRRVSAVEALRAGQQAGVGKSVKRFRLSQSHLPVNFYLGLKDLCGRPKTYFLLLFIFIVSSFLLIVPMNLLTTLTSPSFVTYMGVGKCDIRLDMQQSDDVSERFDKVQKTLINDKDIQRFSSFVTCRYGIVGHDGTTESIYMETGDYSVFPITYAKGGAMKSDKEIALSSLSAQSLDKGVGDTVALIIGDERIKLTVCGIYQDVTNGGKTAKAMLPYKPENALWYTINADVKKGVRISDKTLAYARKWEGVKVAHLTEYINQTFGDTIGQIARIVVLTLILSLAVVVLIVAMFLRMLTARDVANIQIMKSMGFTARHIRVQYITRMLVVLFVGIIVGTLAANTLGQSLVGVFMSGMGISEMRFIVQPMMAYLVCPLALAGVVTLTTFIGTRAVTDKNIKNTRAE